MSTPRYFTAKADASVAAKVAAKYARILGVSELPKIVVRDNLGAKWLGRLIWRAGQQNVMELQSSIFSDENTLERVIAHEMAHHVEFLEFNENTEAIALVKMGIKPREHGDRFQELARKINSVAGANFVTEKSDTSYVLEQKTKPYFLLVSPLGGNLGYALGVRITPKMQKYIDKYVSGYKGRLVKTDDPRWANGPRIGDGGFAMPRDPEDRAKLQQLYDSAKIASRVAQRFLEAVIRKEKGEYCVRSPDNQDWNGGCYPSKEKAEDRLKQVEFFKRQP